MLLEISAAFSAVADDDNEISRRTISESEIKTLHRLALEDLWSFDTVNMEDDLKTWKSEDYYEAKKGLFVLLCFLGQTLNVVRNDLIKTLTIELASTEVGCFLSLQKIIHNRHVEAWQRYKALTLEGVIRVPSFEENVSISSILEENTVCIWNWLDEQVTLGERLAALGASTHIILRSIRALIVSTIEGTNLRLNGLRKMLSLVARDLEIQTSFAIRLFRGLDTRPSRKQINRTILEAVRIEKALATDMLCMNDLSRGDNQITFESLHSDIELASKRFLECLGYNVEDSVSNPFCMISQTASNV
ncbi:hypothetical protein CVT26_000579 [Gymnopilus dilepis]|uniref:Uncharacterized protein n=1 Tax=Gymnopilus dilepis TaxID=231916 RepID=A0A409VHA3_9AGAR|nr:hypothetical protein CVT26_000579 [Gymnopilus dilepis]